MKPPQNAPFLARHSYRMRRLMDAARFLPVLGLILLLLPLMRLDQQADTPPTAAEAVYLFAVWFCLVGAAFLMSLGLRKTLDPPSGQNGAGGQDHDASEAISALVARVDITSPDADKTGPSASARHVPDPVPPDAQDLRPKGYG